MASAGFSRSTGSKVPKLFVDVCEDYGAPELVDSFMFQQLMPGSQHSMVDIPDIS